jgi:HD-like signal output (HDOD) protein
MRSWSMPLEVQIAVSFHNQSDYTGEHALYVDLIFIAKTLLEDYGLCGTHKHISLPTSKIQAIHLQENNLPDIMENFKNQTKDLDRLVDLLAGD